MRTIDEMRYKLNRNYDCCWSSAWALDALDDIEQEIAERYIELPVDADGVPIRPDDLMACTAFDTYDFDGKEHVLAVGRGFWVDKHGCTHIPSETRHVKPRTLEDVLASYRFDARNIYEDPMLNGNQRVDELEALDSKVADEIREVLGVSE